MGYMVGNVHVYVEPSQPATDYTDPNLPEHMRRHHFRCSPRGLWRTDCCGKRRWAKYVRVQVYYDHINRSCAPGRGCRVKRSRRRT